MSTTAKVDESGAINEAEITLIGLCFNTIL